MGVLVSYIYYIISVRCNKKMPSVCVYVGLDWTIWSDCLARGPVLPEVRARPRSSPKAGRVKIVLAGHDQTGPGRVGLTGFPGLLNSPT